ncbi:MAG: RNA polymerase sigma-70 factor [Tannerellaceae bacterium]
MIVINEDIIARVNEGDSKAFEQLYTAYYVYLCTVATKYVYNPQVAQEIVNDVFLNVWNQRGGLTYPVNAYLIRAVQNRSLNHLRERHMEMVPLSEVQEYLFSQHEQLVMADAYPLEHLENKEFEQVVCAAIDTLPEKCRDIFVQYLYHNKTYDEIAQINHISPSTVRVQIKLGLVKLKDRLGRFYPLFLLFF